MRFSYCPHCGTKLIEAKIGDEDEALYCKNCNRYLFNHPLTCVLMIAQYEGKVAIIRQTYGKKNYRLVAGFMKNGESAEDACKREVFEELGVEIDDIKYLKSFSQMPKENLMLGFSVRLKSPFFKLSEEVMDIKLVTKEKALLLLKDASIALKLLKFYLGMEE
jgi:NAD+ diphosphatase